MSRVIEKKELINTRLATNYGGWMYCTSCDKNIGYLCYSTYDHLDLNYECNCGSKGSVKISFPGSTDEVSNDELIIVKNRFCCPDDSSPLVTMLKKNVKSYDFTITCNSCHKEYKKSKK